MLYPKIPTQIKGGSHDIVNMECVASIEQATLDFQSLQKRLKAINDWHSFSKEIKTKFILINSKTRECTEELAVGNLIKIDIPGPGNPSGSGYDWTEIIDLQNGLDNDHSPFFAITIKPCPAPESEDETVAHFYKEESTNTFIVRRVGTCIYAEVHGRNQIENTSDVPVMDLVRNKAVAIGSKLGFGNLNWAGFNIALLKPFPNN